MKTTTLKTLDEFNALILSDEFPRGQIGSEVHRVIFNYKFELGNTTMKAGGVPTKFEFYNCVFQSVVRVKSLSKNFRFENCTFDADFVCKDSQFDGKARIRNCVFKSDTNFRNTKFKNLADFWRSTFCKKTSFYKTDFEGTTVFSASLFEQNVLFTYSLIAKPILFRGTTFKAGLDLSTAIISGVIGTYGINIQNYKSKMAKLSDDEFETAVFENGEIPVKNKRETFRILKQANIQQNNTIESIPFQTLEKRTLLAELLYSIGRAKSKSSVEASGKWLTEKWRSTWDLFVLGLNWLSTSFGRAPFQGVIFTLLAGALFFYLNITQTGKYDIALGWDWKIVSNEIPNYIRFILPTHSIEYLNPQFYENYTVSNWYYIWDVLGRIFVGFGIYQTIQAFRKFR